MKRTHNFAWKGSRLLPVHAWPSLLGPELRGCIGHRSRSLTFLPVRTSAGQGGCGEPEDHPPIVVCSPHKFASKASLLGSAAGERNTAPRAGSPVYVLPLSTRWSKSGGRVMRKLFPLSPPYISSFSAIQSWFGRGLPGPKGRHTSTCPAVKDWVV